MYVVAEITRLEAVSEYYAPTPGHPFCVSRKLWYGDANEEIADFWTIDLNVTEPLTEKTFVTGVVYANAANYSSKEVLTECLLDSQSYFWDNMNQILTIHYNQDHHIDINNSNFDIGIAIGLTNDKIRYFENRPYWPFLIDFPEVEISIDKLNYDQLSFIVDTMITDNRSGFFNQFKSVSIYGNKVSIKTGEDGDTYTELVERASYYVEDYNFSADTFDIDIQDIRKTLTAQVPNKILNIIDYPNIGDNSIGKVVPFAYTPSDSFTRDVPGLLVNETAISNLVYPDFIFLEVLVGSSLSDIVVWIKDADDVWVEQTTGVTVNWFTGIVTVEGARTLSGTTYSAFPVKANVKGIVNEYASDIIKDLNARFLSLPYDTSNYAIDEWEEEQQYLTPVSMYMDRTNDVYEWIKELQSLSVAGFRYTNTSNNKRTIRVDNPNRDSSFIVPSVHVRNVSEVKAQSNKDDVYNKIYIGYNKSILNKTAPRAENIAYFVESFAEYKIERIYNKTSGIIFEKQAIQRAALQAEDYYQIHKVFDIELIGKQYLDIRIYDIIEVNISLQYKELTWTPAGIVTTLVGDSYFELVRGQVIRKKPNYNLKTNSVSLRQKEYSDLFASIYASGNSLLSSGLLSSALLGGD